MLLMAGALMAAGTTPVKSGNSDKSAPVSYKVDRKGATDAITIPHLINYQGKLTDGSGNPINTPQVMTFKLYAESTGGSAIWTEAQYSVPVNNGLFNVLLGSSMAITGVPDGPNCFLEVTVGGVTIAPRTRLVSVPYAYKADTANYALAGPGGGSGVTDVYQDTGIVCVPNPITSTGNVKFDKAWGDGRYIQNQNASFQTANWRIYGTGKCTTYTTNTPAIWGVNTGSLGIGVRGNGPGTGWGVAGYSDTAAVTGMGVIGRARNTAILGKSEYNKGIYGYALDDDGVFGYGLGTTLYRYAGVNGQGGSDSTYGVKGMASAMPGVYGQNSSYRYAAVTGRNTITSVGSAGVAGFGDTINVAAFGVFGLARYHGVYGRSKYYNGVRGDAESDNGVSGYYNGTITSYAGVWGGRGAYGYGVYYSGGLSGSGTKNCVMRTSKGPAALYCQESPENWFEDFGSVALTNGRAHVALDALFLETVTVDNQHPIKVFVQQTSGDPVNVVVQKNGAAFDIVGPSGSNVSFDYRVVAKRKGFEDVRLNIVKIGYNDPVLYPDPNDPQIPSDIRAKRLEAARLDALNGGLPPQPAPSNPTTIKKNAPQMPGLDLPLAK
jgi:hypothetical protein